MEEEKDLRQEVIDLLTKDLNPRSAYQLNKKTGINQTTCRQIIENNWNPRWSILLEFKQKYDSKE